jgi:hypothetical protein
MAATGLGRTTVDKLCNTGELTRVKVGGRALITTDSIRKLLEPLLTRCENFTDEGG